MNKKLEVIPKPKVDSITLLLPKKGETLPLIKFDGDLNLLCGKCGEILVEGITEDGQIMNVVIRCPACRSYNEIKIARI
jgi:phage FluMu protein Com